MTIDDYVKGGIMKKRNALIIMLATVFVMVLLMPLQAFARTEKIIEWNLDPGVTYVIMAYRDCFELKEYDETFPTAPHTGDAAIIRYGTGDTSSVTLFFELFLIKAGGADSAQYSFWMYSEHCTGVEVNLYKNGTLDGHRYDMDMTEIDGWTLCSFDFPKDLIMDDMNAIVYIHTTRNDTVLLDDFLVKGTYPNKVKYAGGEGAVGTAPVQEDVKDGGEFTVAENTFTKQGYAFTGWSDGTDVYEPGETYTVKDKNVVLTAQWKRSSHSVTYVGGEGAEGTAPVQEDVKVEDDFTVAANTFTKTDYIFTGWSDGTDIYMPGDTYAAGEDDVVLTAQWEYSVRTVTFEGGEDAEGIAPVQEDVRTDEDFILPENTYTKPGYVFVGWSDGNDVYKPGDTYTVGMGDVVLTAVWAAQAPQTGYSSYDLLVSSVMLAAAMIAVSIFMYRKNSARQM